MNKEICHVCKKEKKPYVVVLDDSVFSYLKYEQARECGPICERCDIYFAMTGEFKDASEEEFELARKASHFAYAVLKWWEKDKKIGIGDPQDIYSISNEEENKREFPLIDAVKKWYRSEYKWKS